MSPNHGGIRLVTLGAILHSTRSGRTTPQAREDEFELTVRYFERLGTPASAHRVIGILEGQHALCVPDDMKAWHAQEDNDEWLSIEFCQPTPGDEYSAWQLETGAQVVAEWANKFRFLINTLTVARHEDTVQGRRNGKSDPGILFDYLAFLNRCRAKLPI